MRQAAPWRSGRTRRPVLAWSFGALALSLLTACAATPEAKLEAATAPPNRVAKPVEPPSAPAPPRPDPAQLLGMEATHLKTLLGEPNLIRREPPAQVWLYAGGACVFHVYLYKLPDAAGYRVTHYDVSAHPRRIHPARDCFGSLLQRAEHRQLDS